MRPSTCRYNVKASIEFDLIELQIYLNMIGKEVEKCLWDLLN